MFFAKAWQAFILKSKIPLQSNSCKLILSQFKFLEVVHNYSIGNESLIKSLLVSSRRLERT